MIRRSLLPVFLIALIHAATPAAAVGVDFNVAVGADFAGEFDLGLVDDDAETGYSLGLELIFDVPVVELGLGIEYGFDRGISGVDGDVNYTNAYAIARLNLLGPLYLAGRYGYTDVSGELAGLSCDCDTSWSAGAGVKFLGKLRAEILLNNFEGSTNGVDFDYETWSVRLLYTF